jgi:hypothetical protein
MAALPTTAHWLNCWETGQGYPRHEQALLLLHTALPEQSLAELANWSIGRRDAGLLDLRQQLFGPRLASVTACPQCAARLELELAVADLRTTFADGSPQRWIWTVADQPYEVEIRPPTTADLRAIAIEPEPAELLARCVAITSVGRALPIAALPNELLAAILSAFEAIDPQANLQLSLRCAECSHTWDAAFDIVSYLWREVEQWALRTLREVHLLATAYGWGEAEILALTPHRRQLYLDLVTGS